MMHPPTWRGRARLAGFVALHAAAIGLFVRTPPSRVDLIACAAMTFLALFGMTAGYHRYFAHHGFKTSRPVQLAFAILGSFCLLGGPIMWSSYHRYHHKHSDQPTDLHSPVHRGLWWSHAGWFLARDRWEPELAPVQDLKKFPELVRMERLFVVPTLVVAIAFWLAGGWPLVVWGSLASWMLAVQSYFTINSLAHRFGARPFATKDRSTNNPIVALLTLGEWHNNHHHDMRSARHGLRWWEIDVAYAVLFVMSKVGLVWDLRTSRAHVEPASALERSRG